MRSLFGAFKLFAFVLVCLVVIPIQMVVLLFDKGQHAYVIPRLWHNIVCLIFDLELNVEGTPYQDSQTIYMCNHTSYLDIPLIGSLLKASFVAKKEVASWPVFGFLSKLQQTAFISRNKDDAATEKHALHNMLQAGKSLIIFPEGTSTDGREVLPFKSSLFSLAFDADNADLMVQPITLQMDSVDKRPIETQEDRDLYAWHNGMDEDFDLSAHLLRFSRCNGARVTLKFHPPHRAHDFEDRKKLAKACHDDVSNGLKNKPKAKKTQKAKKAA